MKSKSPYRLTKDYRKGIFVFILGSVLLQFALIVSPKFSNSDLQTFEIPEKAKLLIEKDSPTLPTSLEQIAAFNPNQYTEADWKKLGLSPKQIQTLLNYKKSLGEFQSKTQFKKCYAISEELYSQIESKILLPETQSRSEEKYEKSSYKNYTTPTKIHYQKFDPNDYSQQDWMNIGFTEKQAQTILNYKNKYLKGSFTKVEQLEKCYAISSEKYQEMKPFILLETAPKSSATSPPNISPSEPLKPFNINDLDEKGFEALGFTPKQIVTIFKYKKYCGGKFTSLEQFKKCYVVSEEMFEKLKPYIRFE